MMYPAAPAAPDVNAPPNPPLNSPVAPGEAALQPPGTPSQPTDQQQPQNNQLGGLSSEELEMVAKLSKSRLFVHNIQPNMQAFGAVPGSPTLPIFNLPSSGPINSGSTVPQVEAPELNESPTFETSPPQLQVPFQAPQQDQPPPTKQAQDSGSSELVDSPAADLPAPVTVSEDSDEEE
ncbi:hypothetical protein NHX12_017900, partial [Muraenolepis orangiensis]